MNSDATKHPKFFDTNKRLIVPELTLKTFASSGRVAYTAE